MAKFISVNRLTLTLLALLALATASGGTAYQNAISLRSEGGNILNAIAFVICAALFAFAMLLLTRIIKLTAQWGR